MNLGISIFLIFVGCVALRNMDLLIKILNWLERNSSALFLRTLVVGRRQHSKSIKAALDMECGGLMSRFDIEQGLRKK